MAFPSIQLTPLLIHGSDFTPALPLPHNSMPSIATRIGASSNYFQRCHPSTPTNSNHSSPISRQSFIYKHIRRERISLASLTIAIIENKHQRCDRRVFEKKNNLSTDQPHGPFLNPMNPIRHPAPCIGGNNYVDEGGARIGC